ncbi:MAG: hypothetical protein JO354_05915 [Verrucomicrobia bacterium]|nr:hypothetical protein [Verrucomicrobiota bacterium]
MMSSEYYRQFAFVSSVLAGFAFTFYGTLLSGSVKNSAGTWAAFMAVAASVAFLPVTLGMTFAASRATLVSAANTAPQPYRQTVALSMLFLCGIVLLFASFGVSGWIRSRSLGIATTIVSLLGLLAAFFALLPFLSIVR